MNFSRFLNFKSILFGLGIFAVIIAILGFSGKLPIFNSSSEQKLTGTLNVWGTLPASSMNGFVDLFDKTAKTYAMQYTEVSYNDINRRLIQALADGNAPDLIIAPSEIALANINRVKIIPITDPDLTEAKFKDNFADIANQLFYPSVGSIALPISVDPLILYYNKDILSSNGFVSPPTTWFDLYNYEEKITKVDESGNISLSTIALGTYDNIPNITDLLLTMVFQQEGAPVTKTAVKDGNGNYIDRYIVSIDDINQSSGLSPLNAALAFTKDFADPQKSTYNWNAKSPNALNEFIRGNLAFYVGFASEVSYIKSANQKLNFDYTYIPQIAGSKVSATYGRLYTIFMLNASPNQNLAYQVMKSLATGPFSQNLASVTGGISALKNNIISAISSGDQSAEIFGKSVLISKNFYDLHRYDLETLMREAIRQVYNGEKSTVEASQIFTENLQAIYDGGN